MVAGWGVAVVIAAVLTVAAYLLMGELRLNIMVSPALLIGETLAAVLLMGLVVSISRRRQDAALRQLRLQVQEEARMQHRQFLRRLDHELKNPLTAVRAAVADASQARPRHCGQLEVVDAQSRRMAVC